MGDSIVLDWSATYTAVRSAYLQGDKIILPQSALEALLSAATRTTIDTDSDHIDDDDTHPTFSRFDAGNPYAVEAARRERAIWRRYQSQRSTTNTTQRLPTPLTFRLENRSNGKTVYAGIREFSGQEGEVVLSPYLAKALGIDGDTSLAATPEPEPESEAEHDSDVSMGSVGSTSSAKRSKGKPTAGATRLVVKAQQLPKGTYVRLRPLEAGYDTEDWKALLERQLRENFTTLSTDAILVVSGIRAGEQYEFLVDKFRPEGDGICVVDTDLEVDIEPLDEEQARETLRRKMAKTSGTATSAGQDIKLGKPVKGVVEDGDYVDYRLPKWDSSRPIIIRLSGLAEEDAVDLFASPRSERQRRKPREDEHMFGSFAPAKHGEKSLAIGTHEAEKLFEMEDPEALLISVHAYTPPGASRSGKAASRTHSFTLEAFIPADELPETASAHASTLGAQPHSPDDQQCKNCLQWVPKRTMHLHEGFCLRNNVLCPRGCGSIFKKNSAEWAAHWHCAYDDGVFGGTEQGQAKHMAVAHSPYVCPSCAASTEQPETFQSLSALARHRTTTCPGKPILCRFCHLEVPQELPDGASLAEPAAAAAATSALMAMTGLTPHEVRDGARTAECHVCSRRLRLREMAAHVAHHDLDRATRQPPKLCRNALCGRTVFGIHSGPPPGGNGPRDRPADGKSENPLGLCELCFGPLYVALHDPEGKALRRRVERRYLSQLVAGCGRAWCANEWCRTGRANLGLPPYPAAAKNILPLIKPLVDALTNPAEEMHLCVDEASQARKRTAQALAATEDRYWLEWYVAALEAERDDVGRARDWLEVWAPRK